MGIFSKKSTAPVLEADDFLSSALVTASLMIKRMDEIANSPSDDPFMTKIENLQEIAAKSWASIQSASYSLYSDKSKF